MKVLAAADVGEVWPGFWAASMAQRRSVSASFCCIFTYSCRSRARCFCSLATSSVPRQGRTDKSGFTRDTQLIEPFSTKPISRQQRAAEAKQTSVSDSI